MAAEVLSERSWPKPGQNVPFAQQASVALQFAEESAPLSVVLIDVDHFKAVNDTRGHAAGDEVLRGCFEVVSDASEDRGYRCGGDEIGVLLTADFDAASKVP